MPLKNVQDVQKIGFWMMTSISFDTNHYSYIWLLVTIK